MDRPRVVAIAVVDEDIAVTLIYVLRGTVATIIDHLITGDTSHYETTGARARTRTLELRPFSSAFSRVTNSPRLCNASLSPIQ